MRELTVAVTVRRGISKRSHEKIGDCEQSIGKVSGNPKLHRSYGIFILRDRFRCHVKNVAADTSNFCLKCTLGIDVYKISFAT